MSKQNLQKPDIIFRFMQKGYTHQEAEKIWADTLDIIFTAVVEENRIPLKGIGTLSGRVLPPSNIKLFGKEKTTSERLKIKFVASRSGQTRFIKEFSSDAKKMQRIGKIGSLIK